MIILTIMIISLLAQLVLIILILLIIIIYKYIKYNEELYIEEPCPKKLHDYFLNFDKFFLKHQHSDSSQQNSYNETICIVCQVDFEQEDQLRQIIICKHTFHENCLIEWLSITQLTISAPQKCPHCNIEISLKTLKKLSDQLFQQQQKISADDSKLDLNQEIALDNCKTDKNLTP